MCLVPSRIRPIRKRKYQSSNTTQIVYQGNGIQRDLQSHDQKPNGFYVEYLGDLPDPFFYPGDSIKYNLDGELVLLYDKFRDLLFEDTEQYYRELNRMPSFVQHAGQSSALVMSAQNFAERIREEWFDKIANPYRHLYLVDCQFLVGTIQNHLSGMEQAFVDYYIQLSKIGMDVQPTSPNTTMIIQSQKVRAICSMIESYFIKAYSILDIFTKIAIEFENPQIDFSSYKKLKSSEKLWGERKKLRINNTPGTVFESCNLISTIEALRNELVHNGTWELNPKIYIKFADGNISERWMLFPDIEQNHLANVKNRRHFFSKQVKINEILPKIHSEFCNRILNTARYINSLKLNSNEKAKNK